MKSENDIRWEQRFSNYKNALQNLEDAALFYHNTFTLKSEASADKKATTHKNIVKQGIIQSFEYTYELAWNVMRDYAEYQGSPNIPGSRSAIREALQMGIIKEGKTWMDMVESRVRTTHTYHKDTADAIFSKIMKDYLPLFKDFKEEMELNKG
ncbi:nucleotidyltransferase substrate binding protein [Aquimarina sp. ERC-38]|uniref:nucleotidyltransferase substrate binding protein n=1 Tax=Aquimarina sp. ERC-38 TaxID=2949996 RepID=UPI0022463F37|nr:nucleotidyltransferase substrate binding protein [Aquimarina sp. ERC-38]UZO79792.1 nucleotidyltransferase substrate binding protein [Aquimarina sp. ERC-38]